MALLLYFQYTWSGNNVYRINCINVLNHMDTNDGGSVKILQGGPGYDSVVVKMQTQLGQGMNFHLEVYGEPIYKVRQISKL